jgi:cysteine synthase A
MLPDTGERYLSTPLFEDIPADMTDEERPVLMFALEWCEFCVSVRKMFAHYSIPCRSVDLGSVEYQQADRGGKIRAAVSARTGLTTIPQIFVGGEFIGGATDAFDAFRDGRLRELLERSGVAVDDSRPVDPCGFLPGWLHPR